MRQAIYILLFLVASAGYSQESNYPEVANVLVEEFYTDAAKENFYPRQYVEKNLKGIYFVSARTIEKYVGRNDNRAATLAHSYNDLTGKTEVLILVDKSRIDNLPNIKVFLYHELGHFLGSSHEESISPDIMNSEINSTFLTEETLRYYFQKLKNIAPIKYRQQQ